MPRFNEGDLSMDCTVRELNQFAYRELGVDPRSASRAFFAVVRRTQGVKFNEPYRSIAMPLDELRRLSADEVFMGSLRDRSRAVFAVTMAELTGRYREIDFRRALNGQRGTKRTARQAWESVIDLYPRSRTDALGPYLTAKDLATFTAFPWLPRTREYTEVREMLRTAAACLLA